MRPFLTLHDPASARAFYADGRWTDDTFYSLLSNHASLSPSGMALRDGGSRLDWRTLKARADALADDFIEKGLGVGDVVSIWMSNKVDVLITFLACSRIGAACNPSLHRSYTCAEVLGLLTELRATILVTEDGWGVDRDAVDFEAEAARLPFLRKIYKAGRLPMHITRLQDVVHSNPDSVAYLAFTSGSTGRPKCVMHSCNTLLSNARDLVRDWSVGTDDVILCLSPLSHHIGWVAVGQWLTSGAELVLDDPAPGHSRLDWVIETKASYLMGVPTHAIDLLDDQRRRGLARLGAVRTFYLAGAPIPEVLAQRLADQRIKPQNVYGMTECSSHQYTHPGDPLEIAVGTCGRGGQSYEVKIWNVEHSDREVPAGDVGEIGGKGPALMLGYYADQAANDKTFNRHGYLLSGDIGRLDCDGNLTVLARAKDVIIRGGHNIYPARIEALALTHPDILKAAAFAVSDERLGEKVCLAVIGSVGGGNVLDHLAAKGLSKYDMPEWFVSVAEFPLTASGKVLKRELSDMVRRSDLVPEPVRYVDRKKIA